MALGRVMPSAKTLEHADLDADYVTVTDADYTYSAEYVPVIIKVVEENPLGGMVCDNKVQRKR